MMLNRSCNGMPPDSFPIHPISIGVESGYARLWGNGGENFCPEIDWKIGVIFVRLALLH